MISRLAGSQAGDLGEWAQAITEQDAQVRRFFESATPALTAAYEATEAIAPSTDPIRAGSESVVPLELPAAGEVAPIEYASWYVGRQAALGDGSSAVLRKVDSEFDQRRQDTRNDAILLAVITAFAVILAVGLAYAVARSVTRSLRALTRGARDVAERRLPRLVDTLRRGGELTPDQLEGFAPINVSSRDELGDLAKAFNTVQQVTVAVAEQQAELLKKGIGDLYVNLARRNQSLLDRQISLLDDMEARVEDADELGSLFELDHLATRMRRNAESLLVLSGAEQPRQWGTAVPVLDVARGAAAEIAEFTRVTYFGFEGDVAISGNAVADVSHLLAELLENATVFSPPTTPVVVTGRRVEHRYVITITDEGIGVEDERLAAINNLLARPPVTGLALSRTLGLFVVAHLAARYGIGVQLRRAPSTGVTAVVALPTAVLARVAAPTDGHAPPPAPAPVPASPAGTTPMPVVARRRPSLSPSRSPSPNRHGSGSCSPTRNPNPSTGRGPSRCRHASRRSGSPPTRATRTTRSRGPRRRRRRTRSPRRPVSRPPHPRTRPVPRGATHRATTRSSSAHRPTTATPVAATATRWPGTGMATTPPSRSPSGRRRSRRRASRAARPVHTSRTRPAVTTRASPRRRCAPDPSVWPSCSAVTTVGRPRVAAVAPRPVRSVAMTMTGSATTAWSGCGDQAVLRGAQPELAGLQLRRRRARRRAGRRGLVGRPARRDVGRPRPRRGRPAVGRRRGPAEHRAGRGRHRSVAATCTRSSSRSSTRSCS